MSMPLIAFFFLLTLALGYRFYGKLLANNLKLENSPTTVAHKINDGLDYIPTNPFYLFGQHFSAIAAAGPIAGPIIAATMFGWLPGLLWIALGVIFIGATHDFLSLIASVRHHGHSIAQMAKDKISSRAGNAMMLFILVSLIYIIVAFADVTASSFVYRPEEFDGLQTTFHPGAAVAGASVIYLLACLLLGLAGKYLKLSVNIMSILALPITGLCAWLGMKLNASFLLPSHVWIILIGLYCAIASWTPSWLLLQPRGLLGGFVLYAALFIGLMGLFFGKQEILMPAFKSGASLLGTTSSLLPFLFVTIACGACSGFHGLVCSGTTSKQIDRETHTHVIGYGAMLSEAVVAFVALGIVMTSSPEAISGMKPGTIYGQGIGRFIALFVGEQYLTLATTFGAMVFSTFVFDTLDVATRLGRYLFLEFFKFKGHSSGVLGTILITGLSTAILLSIPQGQWTVFWGLFGAANQLLAALTFMVLALWLKENSQNTLWALAPMFFVLFITFWALIQLFFQAWQKIQGLDASLALAITCLTLLGLTLLMAYEGLRKWRTALP